MASGEYDTANGSLEAPGGTSLYSMPYTCTGELCRCGPCCSLQFSVPLISISGTERNKKIQKNKGLGFLSGSTQSTEVTTSPKKVLSNLTRGERGGVGSSSQHTEAMEGKQTFLTKTQKRNRCRQLIKRVEQKEISTESALKEKGGTKDLGLRFQLHLPIWQQCRSSSELRIIKFPLHILSKLSKWLS